MKKIAFYWQFSSLGLFSWGKGGTTVSFRNSSQTVKSWGKTDLELLGWDQLFGAVTTR